MHDDVLVALISTIGTVVVAFITAYFQHLPPRRDDQTADSIRELKEENQELRRELEEQHRHEHDN